MKGPSPVLVRLVSVLLAFLLYSGTDLCTDVFALTQEPPSEAYVFELLESARNADSQEALQKLYQAKKLSPGMPEVYFLLARKSLNFSLQGISNYIRYMLDGFTLSLENFWHLYNTVAVFLAALCLALFVVILGISLKALIFNIPVFIHAVTENRKNMLYILLLPLGLLGLPAMLAILVFFSFFGATGKGRKTFYALMGLLLVFVTGLVFLHTYLQFAVEPSVRAVAGVNSGRSLYYPDSSFKDSTPVVRFSYAFALQSRERYNEAIDVYKTLLNTSPQTQTYINLGNCYALLGRPTEAEAHYKKAIDQARIVSGYYNLSIIAREKLDFINADKYFMTAADLDIDRINHIRAIQEALGTPVLMNERLSTRQIYLYLLSKVVPLAIENLPLFQFLIAFALIVVFFLQAKTPMPQRCRKCGKTFCNRCESRLHWSSLCTDCFRTMVSFEMSSAERISHLWKAYNYQRKRRFILYILSWLLPGTALSELYPLRGIFLSFGIVFFLMLGILSAFININIPLVVDTGIEILFLAGAVVLYLYGLSITLRKLKRGAL